MAEKNLQLPSLSEIYLCLQGEGSLTGVPHLLIRTTGCALRCQWGDSFCDTPYASFSPEKIAKSSDELIEEINALLPKVRHVMITGGGPTLQKIKIGALLDLLDGKHITLETEGSDTLFYQDSIRIHLLSLSPKLSSSTPTLGDTSPTGVVVTKEMIARHEKGRRNYVAMRELISHCIDFQVKFVTDGNEKDLEEIDYCLTQIAYYEQVPPNKVWLMPPGETAEKTARHHQNLEAICLSRGWNYTCRQHVIIHGDKRGI